MKEVTFKRKYHTWTSLFSDTARTELQGTFVSGIKSLCSRGFARYFALPRACLEFTLVFTKTKPQTEDAYQIEGFKGRYNYQSDYVTLDGWKPGLTSTSARYLLNLWNEGYNYVRCEVNG